MNGLPPTESRRVRIIEATPSNAAHIYRIIVGLGMNRMPEEHKFTGTISEQTNFAFLLENRRTGEPFGTVLLQGLNPAGHIEAGIVTDADSSRFGMGAEAIALAVNYGFGAIPSLRKMYFTTTEFSKDDFGMAFSLAHRELLLRNHFYFRGRHWDGHVFSVSRAQWDTSGAEFLRSLSPRTGGEQ